MIKVIAADLDGTLLNSNHKMDKETYDVIMEAINRGVRFIIATGRDYKGAMDALEQWNIPCDYVVSSGAQIRDNRNNVIKSMPMTRKQIKDVTETVKEYDMFIRYFTNGDDYFIGSHDDMVSSAITEIRLFGSDGTDEEIMNGEIFKKRNSKIKCVDSLEEILDSVSVFKIFMASGNADNLNKVKKAIDEIDGVSNASSFAMNINIEVTNKKAQKGIAVKEYIDSLGYSMDEVMVIGDSMNDYSMISMDFGVTVAMENGDERVRKAAKYIAPDNDNQGAAWAIRTFCE